MNQPPRSQRKDVSPLPFIAAGIGILLYAVLSFYYPIGGRDYFGVLIYDSYYNRIMDGRLDLPLRVINYEGHYLADGTAFAYHGLAPLIPRFLLGWLLPTDGSIFPYISSFTWSLVGSICYHLMFHRALVGGDSERAPHNALVLGIGLLSWLATPGIFLAGNSSFYVEPIAVSYAATGIFFLSIFSYGRRNLSLAKMLLACSLSVALAIHARPHVALAMGLGLTVFGVHLILKRRGEVLLPLILAAAIPAASASAYLYVNYLKFGDPLVIHGGFDKDDPVQIGTVFLGTEDYASDRARGFAEKGRFNPMRVPGNLVAYGLDLPVAPFEGLAEAAVKFHNPVAGFGRVEAPRFGILFMWLGWVVIALAAIRRTRPAENILLVTGAAIALALLSYPTVAFRYRAELWPVLAALALVGVGQLSQRLRAAGFFVQSAFALSILLTISVSFVATLEFERWHFPWADRRVWKEDYCLDVVARKFTPSKTAKLCEEVRTW